MPIPEAGRRVDIREGYLNYPAGSHFLFYRLVEPNIEVTRILYQRMDAGRHFWSGGDFF